MGYVLIVWNPRSPANRFTWVSPITNSWAVYNNRGWMNGNPSLQTVPTCNYALQFLSGFIWDKCMEKTASSRGLAMIAKNQQPESCCIVTDRRRRWKSEYFLYHDLIKWLWQVIVSQVWLQFGDSNNSYYYRVVGLIVSRLMSTKCFAHSTSPIHVLRIHLKMPHPEPKWLEDSEDITLFLNFFVAFDWSPFWDILKPNSKTDGNISL